jgi:DNA-binding CsgD family transcriptional regulator
MLVATLRRVRVQHGADAAIPTSAVIPSLVRWGVSPDADLVYRTLATFGPHTLATTARELGMSQRRVMVALDELVNEEAVRPLGRGTEAVLWRAAPPDAVIRGLRRRRLRITDPWEQAQRHIATVTGLNLPSAHRWPGARQIRLLHGAERIQGRIIELGRIERHEHLAVSPERSVDASTVATAAPHERAALGRGVRLHVLSVPPADGDASSAYGDDLYRLGARYRLSDELPLKLMTFDRKVALLPIDPLDARLGAVEIAEPVIVNRLVALFLREWDRARDPRRGGVPAVTLTERERTLVELLAAGLTDPAAARRLGISARTIGYTLRGLMDRLGVENRFQLGLALGAQQIRPRVGDEVSPGE